MSSELTAFTGIGGIATALSLGRRGHHVTILESAPKLMEVGAGIQVSPNMGRLLDRWGVSYREKATLLEQIDIRRWQDGSLLACIPCNPAHGDQLTIHRADLHNALIDKALSLPNVKLLVNSHVVDVNFNRTEVVLADGRILRGDVVLAADGIKSNIRPKLLEDNTIKVEATGDAAYRIILSREEMLSHPLLKEMIDQSRATRWIGPGRHIVAYPLRNHELFNVVLLHPDRGTVDDMWTIKGSKKDMIDDYAGWDSRVTEIIANVHDDAVMEWKLNLYPPLRTWVKESVALLGDACHPMLPYVAQGAAQAVEDAGALGAILSTISSKQEIPVALEAYQRSRKARAEQVQQSGKLNRVALHLPDGPEQQQRDEMFRLAMKGSSESPDRWVDEKTRKILWEHDAEEAALRTWQGSLQVLFGHRASHFWLAGEIPPLTSWYSPVLRWFCYEKVQVSASRCLRLHSSMGSTSIDHTSSTIPFLLGTTSVNLIASTMPRRDNPPDLPNTPAKGISYFAPEQDPPAGTAASPQSDGSIPPKLFQPLTIRGVKFHNRIGLSPLCQYSAQDGHMTDWHIAHLGGIAMRGPGFLMVEATSVTPEGRITPEDVGLWQDSQIEPLRRTIEFVHSQNQVIGVQIAHAGRKASTVAPWLSMGDTALEKNGGWPNAVVGPSDIPFSDSFPLPKAMTKQDIEDLKKAWVAAVKRAVKAGADFVEIHGAHGYLLSSFMSPLSNNRTDEYGGSFENRIRLTLEIAQLTREVVGPNYPVFLRISATEWVEESLAGQPSWTVEESVKLAKALVDQGAIDLLDVSSGGNNSAQKIKGGPAFQSPFAIAIKKAVGDKLLVGTVGTITNAKLANKLLEEDGLDFALVGRSFQKNPSLVWTWAEELDLEVSAANQIRWGFSHRGASTKFLKKPSSSL
ncbi:NADPH dehydrogenase afvA [Talaromyces pinophilus]|nr:NADPH dehydrogenase afvA [Talaromyces pinophilus]